MENVWNLAEIKRLQESEIEAGTYNPMPHGFSEDVKDASKARTMREARQG